MKIGVNILIRKLNELPSGSKIGILQEDNTDPDSMGTSTGLEKIIRLTGHQPNSLYSGTIASGQNQWIADKLNLDMVKTDVKSNRKKDKPDYYDKFILVDTPGVTAHWFRDGIITPDKIFGRIDHHPPFEKNGYDFSDVRNVGAASSIMASYYNTKIVADARFQGQTIAEYLNLTEPKELSRICTAMYIGTLTDIDYFHGNCQEFDQKMLLFLGKYANNSVINEYKLNSESLFTEKEKAMIILNTKKQGEIAVSHSEKRMCTKNEIAFPKSANDLRGMEGVNTAYVIGFNGKKVSVFIRTTSENPDYTGLAEHLGGTGGGKEGGDGRIEIPIDRVVKPDKIELLKSKRNDPVTATYIRKNLEPKLIEYAI